VDMAQVGQAQEKMVVAKVNDLKVEDTKELNMMEEEEEK